MSTLDEFAEGAHALTHRKSHHNLRVAGGYPMQAGIGAYGSPIGVVTGVQTNPNDNDADDQPTMNPDQFGGAAPAPAGDSGGSGGGTSGGSGQ